MAEEVFAITKNTSRNIIHTIFIQANEFKVGLRSVYNPIIAKKSVLAFIFNNVKKKSLLSKFLNLLKSH
jgi:hypothetical protein